MNRLIVIAFSAMLCMGFFAYYAGSVTDGEKAVADSQAKSKESPQRSAMSADVGDGDITEIKRDSSGQFRIEGKANGAALPFLIDTGADVVALTQEAAQDAGLFIDPTSFEPMMQTASGTGNGIRARLDEFEVAGKQFRDVEVVVMEGLETNLLGQSVLRKLGRVELKGDRMVIERN